MNSETSGDFEARQAISPRAGDRNSMLRTVARRLVWAGLGLGVLLPVLLLAANSLWQNWLVPAPDPALAHEPTISRGQAHSGTDTVLAADGHPTQLPGVLAGLSIEALAAADNPLDVVLEVAELALQHHRGEVRDYQCHMVSEVRLNGSLREPQHMICKIREERAGAPFAVYARFLKPQSLNGQEVIWVAGENDGNLVAHQAGLLNLTRWNLPPDGPLAMSGSKYPITNIGLEKLLELMLARGRRDRDFGRCEVDFDPDCLVDGKRCLLLEIRHPRREGPYDFHLARIYFEMERQVLFGYEGYDWPPQPGAELPLLERFFYSELKINPGLTAEDFDPDNPAYNFPGKRRK